MTDSTTIDPGAAQTKKRRATDKPRPASTRAGFNPIHPSMELPPEQLIRLLGLEKKKPRKPTNRKKRPATPSTTEHRGETQSLPAELLPASNPPSPKPAAHRTSRRQQEYEHARNELPSDSGHGLWKKALATGLILGIGTSAYLFWIPSNTPESGETATKPAAVQPKQKEVTASSKKAAITSQPTSRKDDPAWLATIEAQTQRLREEAGKRLEEKLKQGAKLIIPVESEAPDPSVTTAEPQQEIAQKETTQPTPVVDAPVSPSTDIVSETPGTVPKTPDPSVSAAESQPGIPPQAPVQPTPVVSVPAPPEDETASETREPVPTEASGTAAALPISENAMEKPATDITAEEAAFTPADPSLGQQSLEPVTAESTASDTDRHGNTISAPPVKESPAAPPVDEVHAAPATASSSENESAGNTAAPATTDTPAVQGALSEHGGPGIDVAE